MLYTIAFLILIDLYLTLKNPFYPRESRKIWQYLTLIILTFSWIITYSIFKEKLGKRFVWIIIGTNIILFIPVLQVFLNLCRNGTSKDLRKLVVKHQTIYYSILLWFSITYLTKLSSKPDEYKET